MKKIILIITGFIVLIVFAFIAVNVLKGNQIVNLGPDTLDQASAIVKVRALPEVVEYEAMLKNAGKKATFEVEDSEEEWLVHIFEIVSDGGATSHTATFGWYRVNKKTGEIIKDL